MQPLALSRRLFPLACAVVIILGIYVKLYLMMISIWSPNFMFIVKAATIEFERGSYHYAPWIQLIHVIYRLWLLLPIEHPKLDPWLLSLKAAPAGISSSLLILLFKVPILLFDVLSGLVIYKILQLKGINKRRLLALFSLWIVNPYTTLFAEMDGTIDIVIVFLFLLTIYLFLRRNRFTSSLPFLVGIGIKLYSILLFPIVTIFSIINRRYRILAIYCVTMICGFSLYSWWVSSTGIHLFLTFLNYTPLTFNFSELLLTPYDSRIGLATLFGLLFLFLISVFWQRDGRDEGLADACFGFLLWYFAFLNWWPSMLLLIIGFIFLEMGDAIERSKTLGLLIAVAFVFELTWASMFGLSTDHSLFFVGLHASWMVTISNMLTQLSFDPVIRLVFSPLLRSLYTAISLYYGARILIRHSTPLRSLLTSKTSI